MSKVIITGISGLLGSSLARKFEQESYEVHGIKRIGTEIPKDIENFKVFEGDITNTVFLEEVFAGADIVIHTAAKVSFDRRDKKEIYTTNVLGTKAVVDTCLELKIPKLIYVSSVAALGRNINNQSIDEETLWEESDLNSNYAVSKYLAELEFWRGIEEGLEGFCINPSIILGCGDINNTSNKIFSNLFKKIIFYTEGSINAVDLRDVVQIIHLLNKKNITNERYVLNSSSISVEKLMSLFAKTNQARLVKASKILVLAAWTLEGISTLFSGKRSQLTLETLKVMKSRSIYNNTKIIRELDYNFKTIEETLSFCNAYYVDKYKD